MTTKQKRLNQIKSLGNEFLLKKRSNKKNIKVNVDQNDTRNHKQLKDAEKIEKNLQIFNLRSIKPLFILISIGFFFIFIFMIELFKSFDMNSISKEADNEENDWSFTLNSFGTESCIRVYDIDEDGLDDFIFGLISDDEINIKNDSLEQNEGFLLGVKGSNGKILWNITTKSEIFEINCLIDIDLDGRFDCLGAGRKHTLIAFDPHNGNIYWDISYELNLNNNWNIYNPLILPYDFDQDGVNDFLISTGGNPTIPSHIHERESGRIILLSSKNGKQIGNDLILPEDKETYMSPVLHSINNKHYVLFGTGGETVPGNLYIQSLPDFYNHVTNSSFNFDQKYPILKFKEDSKIKGLLTLFKSSSKGVMVPPVLMDVTNDGIKDILVSTFDGSLIMFNGKNFEVIWIKKFECYETYTSPSPGYFDEDTVLDFMIFQNLGTFKHYLNASVLIISGLDGSILWQMNIGRMQIISPLTIQTKNKYRDIFFFRAQGIEYDKNSIQEVYHGINPQQPIGQSQNEQERYLSSNQEFMTCQKLVKKNNNSVSLNSKCGNSKNSAFLSTYGFIIDRSIQESPLIVFKSEPLETKYNLKMGNSNIELCLIMESVERNTGAIGHFTSKEDLDVITIISRASIIQIPGIENYIKTAADMKIFKKNIRNSILKYDRLPQNIYDKLIVRKLTNKSNNEVSINELNFKENQTWNAYMGTYSDSCFN